MGLTLAAGPLARAILALALNWKRLVFAHWEVNCERAGEDEEGSHDEALREDDVGEVLLKDSGDRIANDASVGDKGDFTEWREVN